MPPNVALYLLNQKRHTLSEIEKRYGFAVLIEADDEMHAADCEIERLHARREDHRRPAQELARASYDESDRDDASHAHEGADAEGDAEHETFADARSEGQEPSADGEGESAQEGGRRRRRRRRRRSRGDGDGPVDNAVNGDASAEHAHDDRTESEGGELSESEGDGEFAGEAASEANGSDQGDRSGGDIGTDEHRRRRRGRRGGRRRRREDGEVEGSNSAPEGHAATSTNGAEPAQQDDAPQDHDPQEHAPGDSDYASHERDSYDPGPPVNIEAAETPPPPVPVFVAAPPPEPMVMQATATPSQSERAPDPVPVSIVPAISADAPPEKPKRGWWRR